MELPNGTRLGSVRDGRRAVASPAHGLAHRPSSQGTRFAGPLVVHHPCTGRMRGAASCRLGDSVADIGVNGAACHIGATNPILVLLPRLQDGRSYQSGQNAGRGVGRYWTVAATKVDKTPVGFGDMMRAKAEATDGLMIRSLPGLSVRRRFRRSPGAGRLTPQMGAGDDTGQDAQPPPHRLTLLGGVRWRSPLRRRPAARL